MILKKLKLENIRCFHYLEIELPRGFFAITGRNSIGKTTIIDAITWSLFGEKFSEFKSLLAVHHPESEFKPGIVEMVVTVADTDHKIVRKILSDNFSTESFLYKLENCELLAETPVKVDSILAEMIGIDYQTYMSSICWKQDDHDRFMRMSANDRREMIFTLFSDMMPKNNEKTDCGLTQDQKSESQILQKKRQLKLALYEAIQTKKELVQQLIKTRHAMETVKIDFNKQTEIREKFSQIISAIHIKEKCKKDFELLADCYSKIAFEKEEAVKELQQVKNSLKEYSKIKREFERLEKDQFRIQILKQWEDELLHVNHRLLKDQVQLTKLNEELRSLAEIDEKVEGYKLSLKELEEKLITLNDEYAQIKGHKVSVKSRGGELKEKYLAIDMEEGEAICPFCEKKLVNDIKSIKIKLEKELDDLRSNYMKFDHAEKLLEERITEIKNQLKNITETYHALLQTQEQFRERNQQKVQIKKRLDDETIQLQNIKKEIAACGKIDYNEKHHKEIKSKYKELSDLHDKMILIQEKINWLENIFQHANIIQSSIENLKEDLSVLMNDSKSICFDNDNYYALKKKKEDVEHELNLLHERIFPKNIDNENYNYIEGSSIDSFRTMCDIIEMLQNESNFSTILAAETKLEMIESILPVVNQLATEFITLLLNNETPAISLDHDCNVFLHRNESAFLYDTLSASERDVVSFCLHLAFCHILAYRHVQPAVKFLLFDDVFVHMDVDAKEMLSTTLNFLAEFFPQILVTNNDRAYLNSFPSVLFIKQDKNGEVTMHWNHRN